MKSLLLFTSLLTLTFMFHPAQGISCRSHCAACWQTDQPGVDIKIGCGFRGRCRDCPPGYDSIHCAKSERCKWVHRIICFSFLDYFLIKKIPLRRCTEPNCDIFGPCYCGVTESGGSMSCTVPDPGVPCTSWSPPSFIKNYAPGLFHRWFIDAITLHFLEQCCIRSPRPLGHPSSVPCPPSISESFRRMERHAYSPTTISYCNLCGCFWSIGICSSNERNFWLDFRIANKSWMETGW